MSSIYLHVKNFYFISILLLANLPQLHPQQFTEVAQELGVADSFRTQTRGVHWVFVDSDNYLDLYVSNSYHFIAPYIPFKNRLYINYLNTNGQYIDEAEYWGTEVEHGISLAIGWADYNLDGLIDFYVINGPGLFGAPDVSNEFYRNTGSVFSEVGAELGVDSMSFYYTSIAWGDYNNNGFPDMYVARNGFANILFNNDGVDFTDNANILNIQDDSWHGNPYVTWGDYDNDGDQDLYLLVWSFPNKLFRNELDETGQFVDVAMDIGIADSSGSRSASWIDYDNDGDLDIFLVNSSHGPNKLFRNDDGLFTDITVDIGLSDSVNVTTSSWADYDNDGDQDLFIANYFIPNRLYRNDVNIGGGFTEVGEVFGLDHDGIDLSCAWGDYDNDGDMDLYIGNPKSGADNSFNLLYRNNQDDQNYLKVRFLSANGSFSRYGSRIWVYFANTDSLIGMREIGGGSGRYSQNMYDCHFGLVGTGSYDIVIRSTVRINGENIVLDKTVKPELGNIVPLDIGGFIEVRDTIDFLLGVDDSEPLLPEEVLLKQNYPNPFNSMTTIAFKLPGKACVSLTIYNITGQIVKKYNKIILSAGDHKIGWNGTNQMGINIASGVYFYQLSVHMGDGNVFQKSRKMIMLR